MWQSPDKLQCVWWCNVVVLERRWCHGGAMMEPTTWRCAICLSTRRIINSGVAVAPHILFKASVMCTWTQSVSRWVNSSHFHLARHELWPPPPHPPYWPCPAGKWLLIAAMQTRRWRGDSRWTVHFPKHFHSINCTKNRRRRMLNFDTQANKQISLNGRRINAGEKDEANRVKSPFTHKLNSLNKSVSITMSVKCIDFFRLFGPLLPHN